MNVVFLKPVRSFSEGGLPKFSGLSVYLTSTSIVKTVTGFYYYIFNLLLTNVLFVEIHF